MGNYSITSGVVNAPEKVVIYGPEGIGKSSFAAQFPNPVFIDTEGGTKKLNVQRLPQPTCWAMLLDEVTEVRLGNIPCATLVIDTADWAERMCIRAVCDKGRVNGIEDFGYGKGYTYVKEEFGRLLDLLEDVIKSGRNVVVTAHAQISKFEQPDEMGQYDRWSMKTSKQVAPLLREWCDMLLFATYETIVVKDGDGKNAKSKAQGGKRVLYTTHHACWDAKNRDGLADKLPFEYDVIAPHIYVPTATAKTPPAAKSIDAVAPSRTPGANVPAQQTALSPAPVSSAPASASSTSSSVPATPASPAPIVVQSSLDALNETLSAAGVPDALRSLMVVDNVEECELQRVVGERGYFPPDMPIKDYPRDFVDGCLLADWGKVLAMITNNRNIPF